MSLDPLDTWDSREPAESRMRRRLEREEKRQRAKRRIEIGVLAVAVAFAGSIGVGYATGFAKRRTAPAQTTLAAAPRRAAVPASAPDAGDVATMAPLVEETQTPPPAQALEPKAKPQPKPKAKPEPKPKPKSSTSASPQRFRIAIGTVGYDPGTIKASASRPIVLTVGKGEGCAAGFNMPELGVHKDNSKGAVTFSLGKVDPGRYYYTCSMGMVSGTLIVR